MYADPCDKCGSKNLKGISGIVLTSFPAWYPVVCSDCGEDGRSRTTEEIEHISNQLRALKETSGACFVNTRSVEQTSQD